MQVYVRHMTNQRLRVRMPQLHKDEAFAQRLIAWLLDQDIVSQARVNFNCSSLIIDLKTQNIDFFLKLVSTLSAITREDLRSLVAAPQLTQAVSAQRKLKPVPAASKYELVAPTLSLALAFTANPIIHALNIPLILWSTYPTASSAYKVLKEERRLNVDFLDALAIGGTLLQGNLIASALMAWLIKLGNWCRDLTAAQSKKAVGDLLEFQHKQAWIMRGGSVVSIPSDHLRIGDEVVVFPGEMIPVDGDVIEGQALIDQKSITGEGLPVERSAGEFVYAATVVREGRIIIKAQGVGEQTTAGQIVSLIDNAPIGDTRMQNHAEIFADKLVTPTLGLGALAGVLTRDLNTFLSVIIVDYGTGIRVAAPTSVLASMAHAARSGIIIKSGHHMERLANIDTVIFDKTGTLTKGVPEAGDIICYNHISGEQLIAWAAAAESKLKHPVADALRLKAKSLNINIPVCDEPSYALGLGVEGYVENHLIHVGNERFMKEKGVACVAAHKDRSRLEEGGFSCLHIAVDGVLSGLIPYADQIRLESKAIIDKLRELGVVNTIMLTGDNAIVAQAVSAQLGLTQYYSELMPNDKSDIIQKLQKEGHVVAMVGDGINDSPALSYADVGIAMKHGADVVHESADVVLMEDSLEKFVEAIEISKQSIRLIKQNYGIVAGLNTIALILAVPGGLVSPVITALVSNGSAILASANGIRPIFSRPKRK